MVENNIYDRGFWINLRIQTRVNGQLGVLRCTDWCEDALTKVSGFIERSVVVGDVQIDQYATSQLSHHWLERIEDEQVFIADGTAGQFDLQFPDGYYGTLDDAPLKLKLIYQKQT